MTIYTGKIVKIKLNAEKESKLGKAYKAHLIKLDSDEDKTHQFNINSPAGKYAEKLDLKIGEEITIETGGEYNTPVKIQKKNFISKGNSTSFNKKSFNDKPYDNSGVIKGMVLNNAVQLAMRNADSIDISVDHIVKAAELILTARTQTDLLVDKFLSPQIEIKTSKSKVDNNEDFSNSDEEAF